jgi:hypothetical protein
LRSRSLRRMAFARASVNHLIGPISDDRINGEPSSFFHRLPSQFNYP